MKGAIWKRIYSLIDGREWWRLWHNDCKEPWAGFPESPWVDAHWLKDADEATVTAAFGHQNWTTVALVRDPW